ncbi:MAG: phospholipase D-like domain-containing protein [Proteobacteria bacterium]|jgi:cardiolipin synthase|nr:phospholipase D-like domain-containing protein [Pseudomonadota bacterium]MDA0926740.1 phospholipase D-like domain-containing protein [Pseudomonadota bacterium]
MSVAQISLDGWIDIAVALLTVIASVTAALHALLTKNDSRSALAWVVFCLVLPLIGPITYLILGINRTRQRAQGSYQPGDLKGTGKSISEPTGTNFRPYSLIGERVTGYGLHSCDDLTILENGEAFYPAVIEAISQARERVYLSTYIFQDGESGGQVVEALKEAKSHGADVRIILDGLGGIAYPPGIARKLRKARIPFEYFNPIQLLPPSLHINMRNHRKIVVVDSHTTFIGGQNISDRHLVSRTNNPKCAKDLHFRLHGKIVDDLERAFLRDWNHCTGDDSDSCFHPANTNKTESDIWTRLILDGPNEHLDQLVEVMLGVFSVARTRIWLVTPYFLPGPEIVAALQGAALRGVDVKILLPERSNIHLAHYAAQHNLRYIIERELDVFFLPAPFIHTKAILVDDLYSLIGSANMDPRSLRLNFELGVEVFSREFTSQLAEYIGKNLAQAKRVNVELLGKEPLPIRIRNALSWLFSPYL